MATIVIKDLNQSVELDRKAMQAVTGGKAGSYLRIPTQHAGLFQNPISFNPFKPLSYHLK
jgi:hypothetical protein